MRILDEGPVLDSEIDSLGHLNVRYYIARVERANRRLLGELGVGSPVFRGAIVRRYDTYCRYRRDQFAGAQLKVAGGEQAFDSRELRCYYEIRNPAKEQIAATFVTATALIDPVDQQRVPFPAELFESSPLPLIELPEHGKPRSLSLEPPRTDVVMADIDARVKPEPAAGMMSGRREATVQPEDCDEHGRLREDVDMMFLMHRPQPGQPAETFGPPVLRTDQGHRFGWAMIESRNVGLGRPNAGDRVVAIGADVGFGERWRQSRRWAFVETSGTLIGIHDTLGVALDLDERRSIAIPASFREALERSVLPDLR
jgi:acyl-CoA thioester hydrolase